MAARGQAGERLGGARRAQRRVAAAPDELLGLREELDLADAVAPQLDVVAVDGDHRAALVGVDLPLDGMDVLDGPEVQMLAPDEGPQHVEKGIAENGRAQDGTP